MEVAEEGHGEGGGRGKQLMAISCMDSSCVWHCIVRTGASFGTRFYGREPSKHTLRHTNSQVVCDFPKVMGTLLAV